MTSLSSPVSLSSFFDHYNKRLNETGALASAAFERKPLFRNEETWTIASHHAHALLQALRDEAGFDFLIDVSSIDNMGEEPRFELVYELCRLSDSTLLRIKTTLSEQECRAQTVSDLWATANWHEREIYDMMGITFKGHPDMRRILMWDGYPYHPLRKDFPLEGRPSQMPDIAFSEIAPLEGGPFVTSSAELTIEREPRAHSSEPAN